VLAWALLGMAFVLTFISVFLPFSGAYFKASAPPTISASSLVIVA
jgi:hypothetical protein